MKEDKPKRDRAQKRKQDEQAQTIELKGSYLIIQFDRPGAAHFKNLRNCTALQLLAAVGYFEEIARLEISAERFAMAQAEVAKKQEDAKKPKILVAKVGLKQ